jgi:hypothetical protein
LRKLTVLFILVLLFSFSIADIAIGAEFNVNMLKLFKQDIKPATPLLPPDVTIGKKFEPGEGEQIGEVKIVEGIGYVIHQGENIAYKAEVDLALYLGDTLITQSDSRIGVGLYDNSSINLTSYSKLVLTNVVYDAKKKKRDSTVNLIWGKARFVVSKLGSDKTDYSVKTPVSVAGVKGSDFAIAVGPAELFAQVSKMEDFLHGLIL